MHLDAIARYKTQFLDNRRTDHLDQAALLIARGDIVAFGFDGIFAFIGDADQPIAAQRMAQAKGQPMDKPLALVCTPECLEEFVDVPAIEKGPHAWHKIRQLQRQMHGLGVILPAAVAELPAYATQDGTVLNVWFELPPASPARYLHDRLRSMGLRTMIGTSANRHGESTYVDPAHAMRVFGGTIAAVVAHDLSRISDQRRVSSTMVDFTGEHARLVRHGSVSVDELRHHMKMLGMSDLCRQLEAQG